MSPYLAIFPCKVKSKHGGNKLFSQEIKLFLLAWQCTGHGASADPSPAHRSQRAYTFPEAASQLSGNWREVGETSDMGASFFPPAERLLASLMKPAAGRTKAKRKQAKTNQK